MCFGDDTVTYLCSAFLFRYCGAGLGANTGKPLQRDQSRRRRARQRRDCFDGSAGGECDYDSAGRECDYGNAGVTDTLSRDGRHSTEFDLRHHSDRIGAGRRPHRWVVAGFARGCLFGRLS